MDWQNAIFAPGKARAKNADLTEFAGFEWRAGAMAELDRRAGASDFNAAMLASQAPVRDVRPEGLLDASTASSPFKTNT